MKVPTRYQNASYGEVPQDIKKLFEKIQETRRGLYIHGAVGTGKTHIAYALYKYAHETMRLRCRVYNTTELLWDIRKDFSRDINDKKHWDEELSEYRGLLILDDIGAERMTDFVAETFYLVINNRYNEMLPMVFTSNLNISDLAAQIGDRTASRIVEMCDVVELFGGDRRMVSPNKIKVQIEHANN